MSRKKFILASFLVLLLCAALAAHSGRTDRYGGHNNRKTSGYHYHNAGSSHAAGNPYQDHTKCGICTPPKAGDKKQESMREPSQEHIVMALQAGLQCMGYDSVEIDEVLDLETKKAVANFVVGQGKLQK